MNDDRPSNAKHHSQSLHHRKIKAFSIKIFIRGIISLVDQVDQDNLIDYSNKFLDQTKTALLLISYDCHTNTDFK